MRYYIYLDKRFMKDIFASDGISDFEIDIMTYSLQEEETLYNSNSLSPRVDYSKDEFNEKEKITEKNNDKKKKKGDIRERKDNSLGLSSSKANTYNKTIEKRYINIEEVTDIKNMMFFDKMIKKIEYKCNDTSNRLILEEGIINYINNNTKQNEDDDIFININNKFFWLKKSLLNCDIAILSKINAKVNICGYCLNTYTQIRIIKVLAIYM